MPYRGGIPDHKMNVQICKRTKTADGKENVTTCLSFYETPPQREVSLSEFRDLASSRIAILKSLHLSHVIIKDELSRAGFDDPDKDRVSHFVLRVCCCSSEVASRWVVLQETRLFRIRFGFLTRAQIAHFINKVGLDLPLFDAASLDRGDLLRHLTQQCKANRVSADEGFVKVPFEDALELVRLKRVFLSQGNAYVPWQYLEHVVAPRFRASVMEGLAQLAQAQQYSPPDRRIQPIIAGVVKAQQDAEQPKDFAPGRLSPSDIPLVLLVTFSLFLMCAQMARRSFPLCMQIMYSHLQTEHHLRHNGRRTLTLFLKGAGLSLGGALSFWTQAFAGRTTSNRFAADYAYNVKHSYGKEGKRVNYSPYGCGKIIGGQMQHGEYHVCPYKSLSAKDLHLALTADQLPQPYVTAIVSLAGRGQYQLACQQNFQARHPEAPQAQSTRHPNRFYDESIRYYTAAPPRQV